MKYPATQFEKLKAHISTLREYFDVENMQPNALHYLIFQQCSPGQPHNKLIITPEGVLTRAAKLVGDKLEWVEGTPIIETDESFLLYPEGCNDNHIITAIKKAI